MDAHFCMCFYSVWAFEVHHSAAKWVSPARLHVFYRSKWPSSLPDPIWLHLASRLPKCLQNEFPNRQRWPWNSFEIDSRMVMPPWFHYIIFPWFHSSMLPFGPLFMHASMIPFHHISMIPFFHASIWSMLTCFFDPIPSYFHASILQYLLPWVNSSMLRFYNTVWGLALGLYDIIIYDMITYDLSIHLPRGPGQGPTCHRHRNITY